MPDALIQSYRTARKVLSGLDDAGHKAFPGMFDSDVISLSHGDGTRRPHCAIISAGVLALLDSRYSPDDYHVMTHNEELEAWIIDDFKADGISDDIASNILISHGSTSIFDAIFTYNIGKNRRYLVPSSFYHNLIRWAEIYDEQLVCQYTKSENDYKLTPDELYNSIKESRIDTLFLFNPTQTGAVYTDQELEALSKLCIEFNLTVYVDSVFAGTEFDEGKRTPPMARHFDDHPNNIVTIKSASKFLNLANLRVGWACGGADIIRDLRDICTAKNPSMSNIALEMVRYGVLNCNKYVKENNKEGQNRVKIICDAVEHINRELGDRVIEVSHKPSAGHGILLDLDYLIKKTAGRIKSGCDLVAYLLQKKKLAMSPADSLGFAGCKVRIAFSSVGLRSTYLDKEFERKVTLDSIAGSRVPPSALTLSHRDSADYFAAGQDILRNSLTHQFRDALAELLVSRR